MGKRPPRGQGTSDKLRALLDKNPAITTDEALAACPEANYNTVRTTLARLRNARPEVRGNRAVVALAGMLADNLISSDQFLKMLDIIKSGDA